MIATTYLTNRTTSEKTPASFTQDLVDAARDNPVSTVLIGMGVLWMVMGNRKLSLFEGAKFLGSTAASTIGAGQQAMGTAVSSSASGVSKVASAGYNVAASQASSMSDVAVRTLHDAKDSVSSLGESASDAASIAKQKIQAFKSSGFSSSSDAGGQTIEEVRGSIGALSDQLLSLLHNSPLVVAAAGLAVGAGVAAALPRIAAEDALAAPVGQFKERLQGQLSDAYKRGVDEAREQGLTPEAVTNAVSELKDKLSNVASSGSEVPGKM